MERLLQVIWKIPVASVLCSDREFTAEIRDQYHLKIKKGAEQADSCLACFRQFQKRVRQDNKLTWNFSRTIVMLMRGKF